MVFLTVWLIAPITVFVTINLAPDLFQQTPLGRLIVNTENIRSVSTRNQLFGLAIDLIRERPLLGYGPDTLIDFSPGVMRRELFSVESFTNVPDRVHFEPLDLAIQIGIPGTIIYYGALLWLIFQGWQYSKDRNNPGFHFTTAVLIGITGTLIARLFGFGTAADNLFFWSGIAFILYKLSGGTDGKTLGKILQTVLITIFASFAVTAGIFYTLRLSADMHVRAADVQLHANQKIEALANLSSALATFPHDAETYKRTIDLLFTRAGDPALQAEINDLIRAAKEKFPFNTGFPLRHAQLLTFSGDEETARAEFRKALALAPYSFQVWWRFGQSELYFENLPAAHEKLQKILSFAPPYWQWRETLAQHSAFEKDRYRFFVYENPLFYEMITDLAEIDFRLGKDEEAACYLRLADDSTHAQSLKKSFEKQYQRFSASNACIPR